MCTEYTHSGVINMQQETCPLSLKNVFHFDCLFFSGHCAHMCPCTYVHSGWTNRSGSPGHCAHMCTCQKTGFQGPDLYIFVYLSFMPKHHRKQKITKFGQFFYVAAFNGLTLCVPWRFLNTSCWRPSCISRIKR